MFKITKIDVYDELPEKMMNVFKECGRITVLENSETDTFIFVGGDTPRDDQQARVMLDALNVSGLDS